MESELAIDPCDLEAIAAEQVEETTESAQLSIQELLAMSAAKRVIYDHHQLVKRLDETNDRLNNRIKELEGEKARLHDIEIEHGKLLQSRRSSRYTSAVVVVAMAIGSGLISSPESCTIQTFLITFGWSLVLVGTAVQLGKSAFDLQ